ncbi:uncharacterized protein [Linepithema humile]|uniref:uncharacterized protein n=1 Tax=Linepithema humile TaxID=83485 RepID=UPI00351F558A
MAFLPFFITILLLGVTLDRTYSASNEDIHSVFSNIPRLFYTTSDSNPALSGYSYTTQDFNGGESNVVFTTGADSVSRLRSEMNLMKMPETYSPRDMLDKTQENLISSKQQSEEVEASNKQEDYNLSAETINEEKKLSTNSEVDSNIIGHQETPQQISSFVPYPVFRENLLNLHFPAVFPRYQVSNAIQNQYYPSNPYAALELPLHNFGFYDPAVPLFYQSAITIPDNSFSHTSAADKDIKESIESRVMQKSQINATSSESNSIESGVIKSRSNLELKANAIEETSSTESATSMNTFESTTIYEKDTKKISNKSTNPATTENSVEQITENTANSTESSLLSNTTSINKSNITEEKSTNKI